MKLILVTTLFILGASIGSFLSVVLYRVKNNKKGIFLSRSICTKCNTKIKARHLIPIFSYLFLRGKCAYCGSKISKRYFYLELVTGLLFVVTFLKFNFLIEISSSINSDIINYSIDWIVFQNFAFYTIVNIFFVLIFFYDLLFLEIPDRFSLTLISIIIAGHLVLNDITALNMLLGAAGLLSFFLIQYIISKGKWIGGGDLRMGIMIGALLGLKFGIVALFISYVIGALFSIVLILLKKVNRKSKIPFGPFLIIGTLTVLFYGQELLDFYLSLLKI